MDQARRGYGKAYLNRIAMASGGKTPAWQRKEGKNPSGGLNQKGVDSYRAANPGSKLQTDQGAAEYFLAMRRFLPNFKVLTGNNNVTIAVSDFPATDATATALSPFTITSTTTKVDTRARGRYASIKIENTGVGESWRFGTFQVDLQPDGRRG